MTQKFQVYRCMSCGNMIEVIRAGAGELVCCGQPMQHQAENTTDAATEKHVPVVAPTETGVKAVVGSVPHPMEEKHFIEWIQLIEGDKSYREFLAPGQDPSAAFCVEKGGAVVREYCNLHGLWRS